MEGRITTRRIQNGDTRIGYAVFLTKRVGAEPEIMMTCDGSYDPVSGGFDILLSDANLKKDIYAGHFECRESAEACLVGMVTAYSNKILRRFPANKENYGNMGTDQSANDDGEENAC